MSVEPLASVIILTWNGIDFIEDCFNSVLAQSYPHFELIAVDNASTDGTADWIAKNHPSLHLIKNQENLGFAGGVNIGLKAAKGKFLVLLNQDANVETNWLSELITGMSADETIGIGGCKILYESEQVIWHAGMTLANPRRVPIHIGDGEPDRGQYDQRREVEAVTGCAMGIRRQLLEQIGYFDERFFLYFEDTDFCLRARQADFKIVYFPQARLRHHVGGSLGKATYPVLHRYHISRLIFLLKHYSISWFCDNFVAAEKQYLDHRLALAESNALRHAYMTTMLEVVQQNPYYSISGNDNISKLVTALTTLRDQAVSTLYELENWADTELEATEGWAVQPLEFQSQTPIIGPILKKLRSYWSSIAAKWIEKNMIHQQNFLNRRLVHHIKNLNSDIMLLHHQLLQLAQQQNQEKE